MHCFFPLNHVLIQPTSLAKRANELASLLVTSAKIIAQARGGCDRARARQLFNIACGIIMHPVSGYHVSTLLVQ